MNEFEWIIYIDKLTILAIKYNDFITPNITLFIFYLYWAVVWGFAQIKHYSKQYY